MDPRNRPGSNTVSRSQRRELVRVGNGEVVDLAGEKVVRAVRLTRSSGVQRRRRIGHTSARTGSLSQRALYSTENPPKAHLHGMGASSPSHGEGGSPFEPGRVLGIHASTGDVGVPAQFSRGNEGRWAVSLSLGLPWPCDNPTRIAGEAGRIDRDSEFRSVHVSPIQPTPWLARCS